MSILWSLESCFVHLQNTTSQVRSPYFTAQIWQRTMTCLYRLLIVSFALSSLPWGSKVTEASKVVKNGTTQKQLESDIVNRLSFGRGNSRLLQTSQKKWDSNAESSSVLKNGTTSAKLRREILNLLGLPHKPRISLNTRLHGRKMSAPRYMIDLYNSLENNASVSSIEGEYCCNYTVADSRASGADTIMSYLHHGMYRHHLPLFKAYVRSLRAFLITIGR